ncbi:Hypothetical protein, putative [Bodo saltans]|uniref:Uncharacterized protein n=1 Tax=Bodo saltans TaxID=75058 RepID=A0A0S4IYM4_BODSA|nr:Hypothetical protein, putative [Bodo saltans]|eukprot:CUG19720.1 Hypothetical protein, putative [Bodo saltans]
MNEAPRSSNDPSPSPPQPITIHNDGAVHPPSRNNVIMVVVPRGTCNDTVHSSIQRTLEGAVSITILPPQQQSSSHSYGGASSPPCRFHDCVAVQWSHPLPLVLAPSASASADMNQLMSLAIDMLTSHCGAGPFTVSHAHMTRAQRLLLHPLTSSLSLAQTPLSATELEFILNKVCRSELMNSERIEVLSVHFASGSDTIVASSVNDDDSVVVDVVFAFQGLKGRNLPQRAQQLINVVCDAFHNMVELSEDEVKILQTPEVAAFAETNGIVVMCPSVVPEGSCESINNLNNVAVAVGLSHAFDALRETIQLREGASC